MLVSWENRRKKLSSSCSNTKDIPLNQVIALLYPYIVKKIYIYLVFVPISLHTAAKTLGIPRMMSIF
jgi:hypothetical protein